MLGHNCFTRKSFSKAWILNHSRQVRLDWFLTYIFACFYLISCILVQHQWEHLFRQSSTASRPLVLATVREDIVLPRVGMKIAVNRHSAFLEEPAYHQLRVPYGRVALSHHGSVLSIQILPGERAPIVTHYNAVRVQHRHQLKDESLSKLL